MARGKHWLQVLGAIALTALSFAPTVQAQPASPTASVTGGSVRGAMISGQAVFKSVPFAAPPVGELRWGEPQPPQPWTGTLDTTRFPTPCVQSSGRGSEDCLYLNIWAPEWPSQRPKPVMIWFHGGGNVDGGTDTPLYDGASLAKHGVVVVTAQYRLGIFGFFAHRELTEASPHRASGNYALLDQIAAINWVRANIAAFGGDPGVITIFGESAGAEDVGLLLVSPLAKGLFHRAIAQSGPLRRVYPSLQEQEQSCAELADALDAPDQGQIAFLRALPASALVAAGSSRSACRRIALDGYVLKEQPLKLYAEGRQHPVPFMLGNTLREGFSTIAPDRLRATIRTHYGALEQKVADLYRVDQLMPADPLYGDAAIQYGTDQAHRCRIVLTGLQHQKTRQPFYQFEFARNLPGRTPNSSTHADDLAYTFGEPALADWGLADAADRSLSDQMQLYWTNLAKTGNPNGPGVPFWPSFDPEKRGYMSLAATGVQAGEGLRRAQCDLFLEAERARPTWQHPERAPPR
jgi:para-nitrobenzyl esterase